MVATKHLQQSAWYICSLQTTFGGIETVFKNCLLPMFCDQALSLIQEWTVFRNRICGGLWICRTAPEKSGRRDRTITSCTLPKHQQWRMNPTIATGEAPSIQAGRGMLQPPWGVRKISTWPDFPVHLEARSAWNVVWTGYHHWPNTWLQPQHA